jgi:hypothetical protein
MKKEEWGHEIEHIICIIGDKSKCMSGLLSFASNNNQEQRTRLLVPAAVLSWMLNIFGIVAAYLGDKRLSPSIVVLISSLLNFIIATFTTVAEKSQAGSKIELYQKLSRDYSSLSDTITIELEKHPCLRESALHFMNSMVQKYKDLENTTPTIDRILLIEFNKYMRIRERNSGVNDIIHKPSILREIETTESDDILNKRQKYYGDNDQTDAHNARLSSELTNGEKNIQESIQQEIIYHKDNDMV